MYGLKVPNRHCLVSLLYVRLLSMDMPMKMVIVFGMNYGTNL